MVPEQSEEREPCSSVEPTGRKDTVSIPWSLVLREVAERELSHERRWYHVIRHHVLRNEGVVSFFVETFPQEEDDEMAEALVLQSDFGVSDGAVSAMYGVAHSINPEIRIFDLTHDIPPFHIWEASYRLLQTVPYWTIANAQEARGIAVSHGSLWQRARNSIQILLPLLFTSLERIETVSNAMDLRGFGAGRKRTWYNQQTMTRIDYVAIGCIVLLTIFSFVVTFHDGNRFYNPF